MAEKIPGWDTFNIMILEDRIYDAVREFEMATDLKVDKITVHHKEEDSIAPEISIKDTEVPIEHTLGSRKLQSKVNFL